MKVFIINGSPRKNGNTALALDHFARTLEAEGVGSEVFNIGTKAYAGCIACGACYKTGKCFMDDQVNEIASRLEDFDALALGSPVYYAGPNANLLSILDRLFYAHGSKFKNKLGAAITVARRGGASAAFDRLNKYFLISNMHVVGSNYWNQVYGTAPGEAAQDLEGLKTIEDLAKNMAWLLKAIQAADKQGLARPSYGPRVTTNFIR